jgi:hypothetical protein
MAKANPTWGAPRIHGELLKLGIDIGERSVSRFMPPKSRKPPSKTWRTFSTTMSAHAPALTYLCIVNMLLCMRTTLDLDNQLYRQAKLFAAERRLTLTSVMEDGLRALFQQKQALKTPKPFKLVVFKGGGPSPGVDLSDNSALADLMDSERDAPSRR